MESNLHATIAIAGKTLRLPDDEFNLVLDLELGALKHTILEARRNRLLEGNKPSE